jgi:hypothetical protein
MIQDQTISDLFFKAFIEHPGKVIEPLPHHSWNECLEEFEDEQENAQIIALHFHIFGDEKPTGHSVFIEYRH